MKFAMSINSAATELTRAGFTREGIRRFFAANTDKLHGKHNSFIERAVVEAKVEEGKELLARMVA